MGDAVSTLAKTKTNGQVFRDIQHFINILKKNSNMYPGQLIDKVINRLISNELVPGNVDTSSRSLQYFLFHIAINYWCLVIHLSRKRG